MLHFLKNLVPQSLKNIYHLVRAIVACVRYGFPAKHLKVIGITGTDGKTTTANMIARVLEGAGKRVALASTINFRVNGKEEVNATKYTTLSPFFVQKFLEKAVREGCEYAVLEVSSHSLDQNRLWGIRFDVGVLTNITREHLDYHKTMKKYRRAKRKLFECSNKSIINESLPHIEEFLQVSARRKITYGIVPKIRHGSEEYVFGEIVEAGISGSRFLVGDAVFRIALPGSFNVENALAAIAVGHLLRIDMGVCRDALASIAGVPGRMELVENDRDIDILIDYALTPNALRRVYELLAQSKTTGKIIAVFGACGERDRGKRPIMGSIVDEYADIIILTNEDPYYEDPQRILDEIEKGITFFSPTSPARGEVASLRVEGVGGKVKNETYFRIFDRREAIAKALTLAEKGDTVVITGKGAEETMYTKGKMVPWNDKRVVGEVLENLKSEVKSNYTA